MKLLKVRNCGIDEIQIKDENRNKVSIIYKYYIMIGEADKMGNRYDITYSKEYIEDEFIPVVLITENGKQKYKVIEM